MCPSTMPLRQGPWARGVAQDANPCIEKHPII